MNRIKQIWNSQRGKILISFTGLLLLFSSLTIVPLITLTFGDLVTLRVYDMNDDPDRDGMYPNAAPGLLGISRIDESVLTGELRDVYDAGENFYPILETSTVYAILDSGDIATINEVTLETPPEGAIYLEVDSMFAHYDFKRSEAYQEETGEWREFYDGVSIQMFDLITAIESRDPDIRETLLSGPVDVHLRIWNGRYVIVNP